MCNYILITAILACLSTMLTERCLLHAQMARNKAYALHTPCAPAKSARNNSCLVLIQLQAICLLHSHCNYYTSAFSAALDSTKPLSFVVKTMLCKCKIMYQILPILKWCRGETGLGVRLCNVMWPPFFPTLPSQHLEEHNPLLLQSKWPFLLQNQQLNTPRFLVSEPVLLPVVATSC